MCIQTALQDKIAELTNNGETIATFLTETMHGQSGREVKMHHRVEAARLIGKYGIAQPDNIIPFPSQENEPEDSPQGGASQNPTHPVSLGPTLHDIIAYPLARYIRDLTDDGDTLMRSLCEIMEGDQYHPYQSAHERIQTIQDRHRLTAARELLRHAFAERKATRRGAAVSEPITDMDETDPLNSRIANLVRDLTNDGKEAADLLVRIANNSRKDGNWQPDHRLIAIRELMHRAYDLNYEAVTWDHVDAYLRARDATIDHEAVHKARARRHAGSFVLLGEFDEAYEADDKEAMKVAEAKSRAYRRYINEEDEEPEQALRRALYGPIDSDPDPEFDHYYAPLTPEQEAEFERGIADYYATFDDGTDEATAIAAQIAVPKLTIPINNRSP